MNYKISLLALCCGLTHNAPNPLCYLSAGVGITVSSFLAGTYSGNSRISKEQCKPQREEFFYNVTQCYEQKESVCCAYVYDDPIKFTRHMQDSLRLPGYTFPDNSRDRVSRKRFNRMAVCNEAEEGDDFTCYNLTKEGEKQIKEVVCVRDREALEEYASAEHSNPKEPLDVVTLLKGMRTTQHDLRCTGIATDCNMKNCPLGGVYYGVVEEDKKDGIIVMLTHPIDVQLEARGGFYTTEATRGVKALVDSIR